MEWKKELELLYEPPETADMMLQLKLAWDEQILLGVKYFD